MGDILVVVEHQEGAFRKSTLSAIAAARRLSTLVGGAVDALVLGEGAAAVAGTAAGCGVRRVLHADAAVFAHGLAHPLATACAQVVREHGYGAVMTPASTFGKDFMPRLAGLLDAPLASDIVGLTLEAGELRVRRPMYAGNAIAAVSMTGSPLMFTVRQTAFDAASPSGPTAPIVPVALSVESDGTVFVGRKETKSARPELTEARVVVSGGRGLGSVEGFSLVEQLADRLGAAVGASRAAVDAGWVPNDRQVGQTGKVVAPELYIALGISGALQHLAGMKDSKTIVAINKDPEAPIFQVADYGLVSDLFKAIPGILAAIDKTQQT